MTERRRAALDGGQLTLALEGRSSPELKAALVAMLPARADQVTLLPPRRRAALLDEHPPKAGAVDSFTQESIRLVKEAHFSEAYNPNKPLVLDEAAFLADTPQSKALMTVREVANGIRRTPRKGAVPTVQEIANGPHAGLGTLPSDYAQKPPPPIDAEPFTRWSRSVPPSEGYWQIKQQSARYENRLRNAPRWWYSAERNEWHNPAPYRTSEEGRKAGSAQKPIPHEQFMKSHEWRGLVERPAEGYGYELVRTGF